ncbi:MAG: PAS domain-containing protein [Aquabacterium sp.]
MNASFFRQLVERLPDAFILTTEDGIVKYWSEGARQLFPMPPTRPWGTIWRN